MEGVDIDTNHFLGNHPPHASVDALEAKDQPDAAILIEAGRWEEILPRSPLEPGSHNYFPIKNDHRWTHLRLHIYPDGGVARFRGYGHVKKDWSQAPKGEWVDLAALQNGGKALRSSDMFFSSMDNLLMPGRGKNMGDGWETKRNREPNHRDWVIIRLAKTGRIRKVIVDTLHFKGNYPDQCSLEGCHLAPADEERLTEPENKWTQILPKVKLEAHREHVFEKELLANGPFNYVRFNIFPDGGVSRLRLLGELD